MATEAQLKANQANGIADVGVQNCPSADFVRNIAERGKLFPGWHKQCSLTLVVLRVVPKKTRFRLERRICFFLSNVRTYRQFAPAPRTRVGPLGVPSLHRCAFLIN